MLTYRFKTNTSKLLRGFSCPFMAIGVFGLLQNQSNTLIWWTLIGIGISIIIYDTTTYKKSVEDEVLIDEKETKPV